MRLAVVATSVAAVIAIPLAVAAQGPHMSRAAFVEAVACTAYQDAAAPTGAVEAAKFHLNTEALHQPADATARAHKAAAEIARAAEASENVNALAARACAGVERDA